jgi:small-conductance mechanosensitive channel
MDIFLAAVTVRLAGWTASLGGPGMRAVVTGSITRADISIVAFYLGAVVLLNVAIAVYVTKRAGADAAGLAAANGVSWQHRSFGPLAKPVYILLWILGLYVAATPLLVKLPPGDEFAVVRGVMDVALDLGAFAAAFWFLFRATRVIEAHLAFWASKTASKVDDLLVPLVGSCLRVIVIVAGIGVGSPLLGLPLRFEGVLGKFTSIMVIAAIAVLLIRAVSISQRLVLTRYDLTAADNLRARQVYTQLHVISRVVYVTIGVLAVAAVLMLFQEVRHVGTSLLASAGIVGIIGGFAAQKTLANLFAGFQIALAQPVRQDDVVVVEGEWGRVEEITLTYVIVHIWDDRRLVLPLSYFIEKPFQNWTRTSANIMGSVFVWVDYAFPVDEGRTALKEIIEASPLWDQRYWNLQVSDATEKTMQLRVLATSSDSSRNWDLRCEIREKFIAYIQAHHPGRLPLLRAEISQPAAGAAA